MENNNLIRQIERYCYYVYSTNNDNRDKLEIKEILESLKNKSRKQLIELVMNDRYILRYLFRKSETLIDVNAFSEDEIKTMKAKGLFNLFELDKLNNFTNDYDINEDDNKIERELKFILTEVKHTKNILQFANPEILKNVDYCNDIICNSREVINFFDKSVLYNVDFWEKYKKKYGATFYFVSKDLWKDIEFFKIILQVYPYHFTEFKNIEKISEEIKNNKEIVLLLIEYNPSIILLVNDDIKNDFEVAAKALRKKKSLIKYLSDDFRSNKEYMLNLIKENPFFIQFVNSELLHDLKFLLSAYEINPNITNYIPYKTLIKTNPDAAILLKETTVEEKINHILETQKRYGSNLMEKLADKYYNQYQKKIIVNNPEKNNYYDFFKMMLTSNVLEEIYRSNDYTIDDTRFVEYFFDDLANDTIVVKTFDDATIETLKKRIQIYKNKYRNLYINFNNKLCQLLQQNKDVNELFKEYGLNPNNMKSEIINNKYLDSKLKTATINLITKEAKNEFTILDIVCILERMANNETTIEEALKQNNIEKKFFYKIYNSAKENNPALYKYIKESLNYNKIRGFKKLLYIAKQIIKNNFSSIEELNSKYTIDIDLLLNALEKTELYEPLYNKIQSIINLSNSEQQLENTIVEKVYEENHQK